MTLSQHDENMYNLEEIKLTSDEDMKKLIHESLNSNIIETVDKFKKDFDDEEVLLYWEHMKDFELFFVWK